MPVAASLQCCSRLTLLRRRPSTRRNLACAPLQSGLTTYSKKREVGLIFIHSALPSAGMETWLVAESLLFKSELKGSGFDPIVSAIFYTRGNVGFFNAFHGRNTHHSQA